MALTQTNQTIERLRQLCARYGIDCVFEIRKIVTKGDRILDVTLNKVGGKGLFVKEIEEALLGGGIDLAVHSMKDVPFDRQDGLVIGAVPERVDPRDGLIARSGMKLNDLPEGAKVGTSSLRRAAQLKSYRPDLRIESIRGNIDSRLRKLDSGEFDAIVLAAAGLKRMGWGERINEYLPPELCVPAVGQGALGIECRGGDQFVLQMLRHLNHRDSELAVIAERAFLGRLNGGCQIPLGAYAVVEREEGTVVNADTDKSADGDEQSDGASDVLPPVLRITGMVGAPDGSEIVKQTLTGTDPAWLGEALAEQVAAMGAERILAEIRG